MAPGTDKNNEYFHNPGIYYVEELDYSLGGMLQDFEVDHTPHRQQVHLKLPIGSGARIGL